MDTRVIGDPDIPKYLITPELVMHYYGSEESVINLTSELTTTTAKETRVAEVLNNMTNHVKLIEIPQNIKINNAYKIRKNSKKNLAFVLVKYLNENNEKQRINRKPKASVLYIRDEKIKSLVMMNNNMDIPNSKVNEWCRLIDKPVYLLNKENKERKLVLEKGQNIIDDYELDKIIEEYNLG